MEDIDLIGRRFGHLEVIAFNNKNHYGKSWICRCDCGNEIVLGTSHLIGNKNRRSNRSCGCKQKVQKGNSMRYPDLYARWADIIDRCYKPKRQNYTRFGAKGITVCDGWKNSFDAFLKWSLENGYDPQLSLSRKDKTKPYEPDNCEWVTRYEQHENKSIMSNNKSGYPGVCSHGNNKYRAYISRKGKRVYLGLFDTVEEAVRARESAEEYYKKYGMLP